MGVFDKFLDIMKLNDDDYEDDDFYDDDDYYGDEGYEEKPRRSLIWKKIRGSRPRRAARLLLCVSLPQREAAIWKSV